MSPWHRRQEYRQTMMGNVAMTLAQIALTCAMVLLWFFG
jgi:hypothetical protein